MQYLIDSFNGFNKIMDIAKKLEVDKHFYVERGFDYPKNYSIKDDIVFYFYSYICEYSLVENQPARNRALAVRTFDITFLDNLLGDYLDTSYFTEEFIKCHIERKLGEYSRVLIPVVPYYYHLCMAFDAVRSSSFWAQLVGSTRIISSAYREGRIVENLIIADSETFDEATTKQFLPYQAAEDNFFKQGPEISQRAYESTILEIASFFRYSNPKIEEYAGFAEPEIDDRFDFHNTDGLMEEFYKQYPEHRDQRDNSINEVSATDKVNTNNTREDPVKVSAAGIHLNDYHGDRVIEITVNRVLRGKASYDVISKCEGFKYEKALKEKQEYLIVYLQCKYNTKSNDKAFIDFSDCHLISKVGRNYGSPHGQIYDDELKHHGYLSMYGGTEQDACLVYIADKQDNPLLCYKGIWFSTEDHQNPIIPEGEIVPDKKTAKEHYATSPGYGTRDNPLPLGEPGIARMGSSNIIEIMIKKTIRGKAAFEWLARDTSFNLKRKPETGQEYYLVIASYTASSLKPSEFESVEVYSHDFQMIDITGKNLGAPCVDWVDTFALLKEQGNKHLVCLVYIVSQTDKPVIRYHELWFATEHASRIIQREDRCGQIKYNITDDSIHSKTQEQDRRGKLGNTT